jgi:hypothetical protein
MSFNRETLELHKRISTQRISIADCRRCMPIQRAESPTDNSPGQRLGFIVKKISSPCKGGRSLANRQAYRYSSSHPESRHQKPRFPSIRHLCYSSAMKILRHNPSAKPTMEK